VGCGGGRGTALLSDIFGVLKSFSLENWTGIACYQRVFFLASQNNNK
jgi:hypothetical protein